MQQSSVQQWLQPLAAAASAPPSHHHHHLDCLQQTEAARVTRAGAHPHHLTLVAVQQPAMTPTGVSGRLVRVLQSEALRGAHRRQAPARQQQQRRQVAAQRALAAAAAAYPLPRLQRDLQPPRQRRSQQQQWGQRCCPRSHAPALPRCSCPHRTKALCPVAAKRQFPRKGVQLPTPLAARPQPRQRLAMLQTNDSAARAPSQ